MKKIVIYYSHRQTLGHQSRICNIARGLLSSHGKKADVVLLNAGLPEETVHFPSGTKSFDLPTPFHSKRDFRTSRSNFGQGDSAARATFMLKLLGKLRPDVFVTEFFPFGRPDLIDEIFPVLRSLRRDGVRILSSLGYPYVNPFFFRPDNFRTFLLLEKFYDRVLIHTPYEFENPFAEECLRASRQKSPFKDEGKLYRDCFRVVKDKVIYTGYIVSDKMLGIPRSGPWKSPSKGRRFIVVSRGGGVIYPKLITASILAQKILGPQFSFLIVPGPASTSSEMAVFRALIQKTGSRAISLQTYVPDLFRQIGSCDVSVSMCGYNTSTELLYFGKKSVIVPWQLWNNENTSYFNDQLSRSYMLKNVLNSRVVLYNAISADVLAEGIRQQLDQYPPRKVLKHRDFEGAEVTAKHIMAA